MSNPNVRPSDRATILAVINPQSASSAQSSGWISVVQFAALQALIIVGAIGSSATVDAKIEQATSAAGAGAKDVTGKAITQLTKAGSDDNKQAIINFRPTDLDFNNGFTHVRLTITPATAASLICGVILGSDAREQPPTDATTVDEVVGG